MPEFDAEMRNSYKSIKFDIIRKIGVLDVKDFFLGWLNYSKYGTPRRASKAAIDQGGRDEEALHIHFYKHGGHAVVKYKVYEDDTLPYLPLKESIPVSEMLVCTVCFTVFNNTNRVQVFREQVHECIPLLISADPNQLLRPKCAALNPWPKQQAVLEGILSLSRLDESQKDEWLMWFTNLPKV